MEISENVLRLASEYQAKKMNTDSFEKVLQYIDQHLAETVTLVSVSNACQISVSSISQSFRKRKGLSFGEYLTQIRLERSQELIAIGTPLKDVAKLSGYKDYSCFYRAFTKKYGISPREFKLLLRKKING